MLPLPAVRELVAMVLAHLGLPPATDAAAPVQAIAPPVPKPKATPEEKAAMHEFFYPEGKKEAHC